MIIIPSGVYSILIEIRINHKVEQFSICNQFTDGMIIRLALLEDKINPLFERYNYLYSNQNIDMKMSREDLKFKQTDAFMAIITSILDIRIDLLKMKLNIQENPGYMNKAAHQFTEKIDFYNKLWEDIRDNAEDIKEVSNDMKEAIEKMNWWQKNMPDWLFGKRKGRKELEKKSDIFEKESLQHQIKFKDNIEGAMKLGNTIKKSFDGENKMSLVYWKDDTGEYSYYTDDLLIQ